MQLRSENPVWWADQHERYGMDIKLHDLAKSLNQSEAQFDPRHDTGDIHPLCTPETKIPKVTTPINNPWPKEPDLNNTTDSTVQLEPPRADNIDPVEINGEAKVSNPEGVCLSD